MKQPNNMEPIIMRFVWTKNTKNFAVYTDSAGGYSKLYMPQGLSEVLHIKITHDLMEALDGEDDS